MFLSNSFYNIIGFCANHPVRPPVNINKTSLIKAYIQGEILVMVCISTFCLSSK